MSVGILTKLESSLLGWSIVVTICSRAWASPPTSLIPPGLALEKTGPPTLDRFPLLTSPQKGSRVIVRS